MTDSTTQILIQVLLLLATGGMALYFLQNRSKARAKAWVKLGFLLFIVAAVWAVLRPNDLTAVANFVGVGRGTDLVLYVLVVAFIFTTLSSYVRFREQELRYAQLARAVALQNPVLPEEAELSEPRVERRDL